MCLSLYLGPRRRRRRLGVKDAKIPSFSPLIPGPFKTQKEREKSPVLPCVCTCNHSFEGENDKKETLFFCIVVDSFPIESKEAMLPFSSDPCYTHNLFPFRGGGYICLLHSFFFFGVTTAAVSKILVCRAIYYWICVFLNHIHGGSDQSAVTALSQVV